MKANIKILSLMILAAIILSMSSCAAGQEDGWYQYEECPENGMIVDDAFPEVDADNTQDFKENPFVSTATQNISTFSADVDTASYSYFRKLVNVRPNYEYLKKNNIAFRTEEFINYFDYDASSPEDGELFGVTSRIFPCPWNDENMLLRLTLRADDAVKSKGNNLVFLIDVSGSMSNEDKLPLLKKTFSYLVDNLTERDRISIVTYSGAERVLLQGCSGADSRTIYDALNDLSSGGSTNGEAGIKKAYEIAQNNYIEGGNNRIIMASDGDLNVGIHSAEDLKKLVSEKKDEGVYLSVLGFGTGNYRDGNMEAIADNGNGVYYYIDGESEAKKVLGEDLLGTLYTVAEDVKLQITFNENVISEYRLIGYENRILNTEDFEDDKKDAGEVGAGHQVTVCYELKLKAPDETVTESNTEDATADPEEGIEPHKMSADIWLTLAVRHKAPGEDQSQLREYAIGNASVTETPSNDDKFISCVIKTCMLLHDSKYIRNVTLADILTELNGLELANDPYRAEFRDLLRKLTQ